MIVFAWALSVNPGVPSHPAGMALDQLYPPQEPEWDERGDGPSVRRPSQTYNPQHCPRFFPRRHIRPALPPAPCGVAIDRHRNRPAVLITFSSGYHYGYTVK
jgi:hypothetical protein